MLPSLGNNITLLVLRGLVFQKKKFFVKFFPLKKGIKHFHTKVIACKIIGPHNEDVISVIVGSLLGDAYASSRSIEGTRFVYKQSIVHKEYLFWLYNFF